jgi:uncharacterized protein YdeI (YjbR/CyaY-like superfamily)
VPTGKATYTRHVSEAYERVQIRSRAQWRRWLETHHASSPGVWAVTYKKGATGPSVPYEAIVEEALCFGWIDSVRKTEDTERSRLLVTPRKPKSRWSRVNKERVERLRAKRLMTRAGEAAIEVSKKNGNWDGLDAVERLEEPDDLRVALDRKPRARANWDSFPRSTKRAILEWISTAKKDETRAKRVAETVSEAAAGRRANQWRQPGGAR